MQEGFKLWELCAASTGEGGLKFEILGLTLNASISGQDLESRLDVWRVHLLLVSLNEGQTPNTNLPQHDSLPIITIILIPIAAMVV